MMRAAKQAGERIAFVAGPVVVHTGGGAYFCDLVRHGYVDVLLAGNALAVHDVEQALYGTSLGVDMESGRGRSRAATVTTCAPSTRCIAPADCAPRSRRAS